MKKRLCFIAFISVRFIYCAMAIIIFSFYASAQDMAIRIYTAKDGLPCTFVYCASQDKLGYLWIGTPNGLSRFDGENFTNYGLADGLKDTRAGLALMDSKSRLWCNTPAGIFEFKGNRFISYPFSDSQDVYYVGQIIETKTGHIWSLTNAGVYQFNVNKWDKIKLYPGYENHPCVNIIETNEGAYINYGDVLVLQQQDNTYKLIGQHKDEGHYYNNLVASHGKFFISTLDGIFSIIDQQLVKMPGELGKLKGLYSYFIDSKKRFWIGKFKIGIQVIASGDTTHLKTVYSNSENFLPQSITEDKQGNIWIGSDVGLIRISDKGFKVFDVRSIVGKNALRNVYQLPDGPLTINDGSLNLKVFEDGSFHPKKLQLTGGTNLPNNELIVDNYAFDDKGRYWYYLRGFSLAMQDGNNVSEQIKKLAHLGNEIFDVLFDTCRKKITVSVRTQNLPCQFNDTSFNLFKTVNNVDIKGSIRLLHQCLNGTILFSTNKGLVYSIDKQNVCMQQLNEFNEHGPISKLYNDSDGNVWILYNGRGVRCYSWHKDSLIFKEQITKTNGLTDDNASSMCFDNNNNLWICNNSNVTVFAKQPELENNGNYKLISFFDAEDLKIGDSYDTRIIKDKEGNLWLFSGKHLLCFYPDKINYDLPVPSIQIERLELNLEQTNWRSYADSSSGIFQLPQNLQLTYDNNTIGIYFKGISSSGTDGIKYSYQLQGLGSSWSTPSSNDFVSFVKLPPGKYIFKVKARLPNTRWSEPATFAFEIKKAFWQTWWFYTLTGIVLLGFVYILFRYRLDQKVKLLEMRNRFSQDLHDEIGSSISGINLLSQMAAEKLDNNKPGEAAEYLSKVKNYSQDVIEKLSDMVWVFNPQNDSIEKLLQRLKSFSATIALSKNIKIHFAQDKESELVNLSIQQRKVIYLVSKEAINNIFKYADCLNIYYSLKRNGSNWQLRIQDDGKGFITGTNKNGNGLKNMQARTEEINATFNIQSQPGNGTIITVAF